MFESFSPSLQFGTGQHPQVSHYPLHELRRHLNEYAGLVRGGHSYSYLVSIETITELTPSDRTGIRLQEEPLTSEETASLDIELWHGGNRDECYDRIDEIKSFLRKEGLEVTDSWVGDSLCLLRAKVNSSVLETLLNIDYIKEIDRRPVPTFEMLAVSSTDFSQIEPDKSLIEEQAGILIIDSGVMQGHPLLRHAIGDAQVFPDRLRKRISGGAEDGDEKTGGHGTAVAGIAVYNDIGECISTRTFRASARLFSARITDDQNQYDEDELVEHQLEEAVEYFLSNYPIIKVINISLGNAKLVYSDERYQFRFAAAIDELAYRYRDHEVVFVVSTGNYWPEDLEDEEILQHYPNYLLSSSARVIDPATSAIAITVGGLSYGEGKHLGGLTTNGTERLIAGERAWPSPFTRRGWGMNGAIKPELVDFAGDMRFERGRIPNNPAYAGLPTTAKNFAPPDGKWFRTVSGTSFAAPRVANIAARLFSEFPNASSNLIRALIADDPPTRHTRSDSYLGITMKFTTYRNITPEKLADAMKAWKSEEREDLEDQELPSLSKLRQAEDPPFDLLMKPKASQLKKGTLQRAILRISRANWNYNGDPLVLAVTCQRKWASADITHQRFAVVVSLYHDNPSIDIYSHVQQHVRVHQRVRVQV